MSKIFKVIMLTFIVLFQSANQRSIPHRDSRYLYQSDCDLFKAKKLPAEVITEAQTCFDYKTDSGFQCCYTKVADKNPNCMVVKANNSTDLHELMDFVSNHGNYATVTCNGNVLALSFIILSLIFLI